MERVEWRYTPATSRPLRVLSYLSVGALGGLPLGVLATRARFLRDGRTAELLVTTAALLIAPAVIVVIWRVSHMIGGEDRTPELSLPWTAAVAVLVGAAIYGFTSLRGLPGALGLIGVGVIAFGGVAAVGILRSEGTVDPENGVLKYSRDEHSILLDEIATVASIDVGTLSFVWISYEPGAYVAFDSGTPRFLVMSTNAKATLQRAVDA